MASCSDNLSKAILFHKGDISMNQLKSVTSQSVSNLSAPKLPASALNASGQLRFNIMNDYMFRAVLQSNNKVLRGLICSLLHLFGKDCHFC